MVPLMAELLGPHVKNTPHKHSGEVAFPNMFVLKHCFLHLCGNASENSANWSLGGSQIFGVLEMFFRIINIQGRHNQGLHGRCWSVLKPRGAGASDCTGPSEHAVGVLKVLNSLN